MTIVRTLGKHVRKVRTCKKVWRKRIAIDARDYKRERGAHDRWSWEASVDAWLDGTGRLSSVGQRNTMSKVMSYETGEALQGDASDVLERESGAAAPTGAVKAYRDASGVWQFCAPADAARYQAITVYVSPYSHE